jgi:hypothetical protein
MLYRISQLVCKIAVKLQLLPRYFFLVRQYSGTGAKTLQRLSVFEIQDGGDWLEVVSR